MARYIVERVGGPSLAYHTRKRREKEVLGIIEGIRREYDRQALVARSTDTGSAAMPEYVRCVDACSGSPDCRHSLDRSCRTTRRVLGDLTVERNGVLYFRSANGVPMEMSRGQRKRLRAALGEKPPEPTS